MGSAPVIIGDLRPPVQGALSAARFRTAQLSEFHEIGADGLPARHRTVQTIRALIDGISTHQYIFDLAEARVEEIHGGTPGEPYRIKGSLWAVDLELPRTLCRDEEHAVEYVTAFRNDGPIEPHFRRAAHRRIENASIRVTFHPEMLPQQVWWAEWVDYREPDDRVLRRTPVSLDASHGVEQRVSVLERAVAGFLWAF